MFGICFLLSLFFINWATKQIDLITLSISPSSQLAAVSDFDSSLVAHYTFDEGMAADSSGNGNNGTLNGATPIAGQIGQALSFDGSNDYIKVPDNSSLDVSTFSIGAWFKLNSLDNIDDQIIERRSGTYNNYYLNFWLNINDDTDDKIYAMFGNGVSQTSSFSSDNSIIAGQWYNIIYTFDGITARMYINGILQSNTATPGFNPYNSGDQVINIGRDNNSGTPSKYFRGFLDDVRIYNRALTPAEISELYALGSASTADTTPPSVPANFAATAVSSSQINLSWSAATDNVGVAGYRIYRNGTELTTTSNTFYLNTGLSANTTYSYTVSAYDAAGNPSFQSSQVSATTQIVQTITTHTLTVSKGGTGQGTVTGTGINCGSDCSETVNQSMTITLIASPQSGSTFAGWSGGGCSGTGTCTVTLNTNTIIMATFNNQQPATTCPVSSRKCWYVDKNATGINSGTSWTEAWESFLDIRWSMIQPGDVIFISGGANGKIYNEKLYVRHQGTSEADRIYIRTGQEAGHNGRVTILQGIQMGDESGSGANYVTVDGSLNGQINLFVTGSHGIYHRYSNEIGNKYFYLDISTKENGNSQTHGIELDSNANDTEIAFSRFHNIYARGIREGIASNIYYGRIKIHDNTFVSIKDDPIAIDGGVDVYDNVFDGTGSDASTHPDAIQGVKGFWRIYNNIFHDHTQEIFLETTSPTLSNVFIYNNIFYDADPTATSPAVILRAKIPLGNHFWSNIVIANNNFIGMKMTALRISADRGIVLNIHNSRLENNIFANNAGNILMNDTGEGLITWGTNDFVWRNNIFSNPQSLRYQNTVYTSVAAFEAANPDSTGNLASAPTFIDPANRDYHLAAGSAGIGAGLAQPGFSLDADGTPRPQGSAWDIGAYEYTGTVVNPPPTVYTPGDFNRDGIVNAQDFSLLKLVWNQSNTTYDLNTDGIVNSLDYVIMVRNWTG